MSSNHVMRKTSLRFIICNFTPAWFAVIMGTGSISILFHAFPYGNEAQAMKILSLIFFFLNLLLFVLFTVITTARYILFPDVWSIMLRHPVQSLYLGCIPMGATTLINVAVNPIYESYHFGGRGFVYTLWGLWWVDVGVSVACCWGLVHIMQTTQNHSLEKMSAVWLLPVVTLIVASSSGGVLAPALESYSDSHALLTVAASIFMVTIGFALAFMMLIIYLLRLIVYGLPPGATIISVFLPLGPTGQAGYSILLIGQAMKSLLPLSYGTSEILMSNTTGDTINVICLCLAFLLWSFATMWLIFALLGVTDVLRQTPIPFKVPFWGLIFPNGVYANLTIQLYRALDSPFFKVYGAIYAIFTLIMWIGVATRSLVLLRGASIFEAPCLEDVDLARFLDQEVKGCRGRSTATSMTAL